MKITDEMLQNSFKVWFNGIELTQYFRVKQVTGRGLVNAQADIVELPGRHGGYLRKKKRRPPRPISIEALFMFNDETELHENLEELSAMLNVEGSVELVFSDEPNRTYLATYTGVSDKGDWKGYYLAELHFTCPDPDKFGFEESIDLGPYPIRNEGKAETHPVIIVHFTKAASEYKIEHANGKFVRIIYNFVAGDKLEIDLTKRKAKINNTVNMPAYDWRNRPFALLPGENTLTVTPASVGTTTIKFRPRWL